MKLENCKAGVRVVYRQGSSGEDFGVITEDCFGCDIPEGNVWVKWDSDGKNLHTHCDNLNIADTVKTTPHKHVELIKAWADGAKIQTKVAGEWKDTATPLWYTDYEYRIKPEFKVLHKIGNKYRINGEVSMLVSTANKEAVMVSIEGYFPGYRLTDSVSVNSFTKITEDEFSMLVGENNPEDCELIPN